MKYKALSHNNFGKHLLNWYYEVKRDLPWRKTRDPYIIWVSEIILQQTRIEQGLPYFHRFIEIFPDIFSLAKAAEQKILKVWEGLGYYSRARNMHKCARIIVKENQGKFPENFEDLLLLPGVGKYTAAAISSFAFRKPVPASDGNVIRVLTRLYRISENPHKSGISQLLFERSLQLISRKSPHHYNQAMMELGATVCKPKNPLCSQCPIQDYCQARAQGDQLKFPVKKEKARVRKRYFNYVILKSGDKAYMQVRKDNDIWKGLYEFLLVESDKPMGMTGVLDQVPHELLQEPEVIYESREYRHMLSHQEIRARFIEINVSKMTKKSGLKSCIFHKKSVKDLPKSILIKKYLEERPI